MNKENEISARDATILAIIARHINNSNELNSLIMNEKAKKIANAIITGEGDEESISYANGLLEWAKQC